MCCSMVVNFLPRTDGVFISPMRYSIVHHDVRERFGLSLHEYIVCDAIYQLSYHYGVTKSNAEMSLFLGVDRANISRIKERLHEKGLIEVSGSGCGVTPLWTEAITGVQNQHERAPSTPPRARSTQNVLPAHHSISKEYKEYTAKADFEIIEEREKPKEPKDTATKQYDDLCRWAEERRGFKFVARAKQYAALKKARLAGISITKLKDRWMECEGQSWRDGFDWTSVVSSFDKKS